MVFIVVRHGESEWNKENKFTGWENPKLSSNGVREAETVGKLLENIHFDYMFSSDLERTIETACIIMAYNANKYYNVYHKVNLRERNYGSLTGKNKKELEELYGREQIKIWRRSWDVKPPVGDDWMGESLSDVSIRVGDFFDTEVKPILIDNNYETNILIVAHGNSLRALFVHLGLKTPENIADFEIATGVPISIDVKEKKFSYINRYELEGTQIIDSRGYPTLQVECFDKISKKRLGKGSTPSGASCGSSEAVELRDGDKSKFMGKSVFKAIENLNILNQSMCMNKLTDLVYLDKQMIGIDSTYNKNILGGNTTTATSFCFADVGAKLDGCELFEYFSSTYNNNQLSGDKRLPTPMVNIINGGKHGVTDDLKIQEFMILCNRDYPITKQIQIICEVYHGLKKILVSKYGEMAKSIGDEGGFCPPIYSAQEAIQVIKEAIIEAGYIPGSDVFVALDCASSEFYSHKTKLYEIEKNKFVNSAELVDYYSNLINEFPFLVSIEDGFEEADYEGWKLMMEKLGSKIMIVGDDLFTTNPRLIAQGIQSDWANSLLLKVNQVGTITEAVEGARLMKNSGFNVIVSHRSGETNHAYIVDLAVGIGAQYLKIGSPCRGERVAKFNRLIEIDNLLNKNIK
jgi:enolase